MMLSLLMAVAWACEPSAEGAGKAHEAFDDAEVAAAKGFVAEAIGNLGCQTTVVSRATLLDLYRLSGLIALAENDERGAIEATMRAVMVDPLAIPPPKYGPELAEIHRSWAGRLSDKRVVVGVLGGGTVFIDGEPLRDGQRLQVVKGTHFVQIDGGDRLSSVLDDFTQDRSILTGVRPPGLNVVDPSELPPEPVWQSRKVKRRSRPKGVLVAGIGLAATGLALGVVTGTMESSFHKQYYEDYTLVDRDALRIRSLYAVSYVTAGLGAGSLLTYTIGFPVKKP